MEKIANEIAKKNRKVRKKTIFIIAISKEARRLYERTRAGKSEKITNKIMVQNISEIKTPIHKEVRIIHLKLCYSRI